MNHEQFCCSIKDEVYENLGLNKIDYTCKLSNIDAFLNIDREGLENGRLEKRLLMYKSLMDEAIYIEYPGKESTKAYETREKKNLLNPNDFRPELYTKEGEVLAKMSFVDIIEALVEYSHNHDKETMQRMAALIVKIAYMKGYKNKELNHPSHRIIIYEDKTRAVMEEKTEDVIERFFFPINKETKEYLKTWDRIRLPSRHHEKKIDVSIEGFLYYLDVLAQQEDCKYYYKEKSKGGKTIDVKVGRINNLLTVVNVIDRLLCDRPYGDIVSAIGRYVRPIRAKDIESVTGGIIKVTPEVDSIIEIEIV